MSTGTQGTQGTQGYVAPTTPFDYTLPIPVPTGPTGPPMDPELANILYNGTGPTGSTESINEPKPLVTLDELLESSQATQAKESVDRGSLSVLLTPTRDMYLPSLLNWAATGFQPGFQVFSLTINPPAVCSDGVIRSIAPYITYLTDSSPEQICETIQATMTGITFFHSFVDNTIRIHVSKL